MQAERARYLHEGTLESLGCCLENWVISKSEGRPTRLARSGWGGTVFGFGFFLSKNFTQHDFSGDRGRLLIRCEGCGHLGVLARENQSIAMETSCRVKPCGNELPDRWRNILTPSVGYLRSNAL